jgi:hypothetical protein
VVESSGLCSAPTPTVTVSPPRSENNSTTHETNRDLDASPAEWKELPHVDAYFAVNKKGHVSDQEDRKDILDDARTLGTQCCKISRRSELIAKHEISLALNTRLKTRGY